MERTHVRVETDKGTYEAASMVACAGAWLGELIPSLSKILKVERQPQLWFAPTDMTNFRPGAMPSFIHFVEDRAYFGIPSESESFVKIGQHHGGAITRASEIDRFISAEDEERVRSYIREFMPKADGPLAESHVCMYTNTPDDHFILDRHPEYANVYIAGGFSGHGYKFTPVVGEYMRNAVLAKPNEAAFELFRLGRFQ